MSTVIFGIHAVQSRLQKQPEQVDVLYFQQGKLNARQQSLKQRAQAAGIRIETRRKVELDDWAQGNHQGVVLRLKPTVTNTASVSQFTDVHSLLDSLAHPPLLLILDGVQDPHNLGACLRSADAAGVDAVVIPKDKAVSVNATVSKVACGAAESVPVIMVTNLARTLEELKARGIWVMGLAGEAEERLYQADLTGPIALVMGGEAKGLRRLTRDKCDKLLSIPMRGTVSSLNVSVATGVCLFEVLRQKAALSC